jgi:hypothetical protein
MAHSLEHFDKSRHNYLQRCFYMLNLIKQKNYDMWEIFHGLYCATKPEESWELYSMLVEEYRKLLPVEKKRSRSRKKAA